MLGLSKQKGRKPMKLPTTPLNSTNSTQINPFTRLVVENPDVTEQKCVQEDVIKPQVTELNSSKSSNYKLKYINIFFKETRNSCDKKYNKTL